jgi:hypothetical protein
MGRKLTAEEEARLRAIAAELDAEREAHKATAEALERLVNRVLDFCGWDSPQRRAAMLAAMWNGVEAFRRARGDGGGHADA